MPKAAELKRGTVVSINGVPHIVEDLKVSTPSARGASSLYRFRFRNIATHLKLDRTCKGDDLFADADVERRPVQFLYAEQDEQYTFMDMEDYSQFTLAAGDIADQTPYLAEELEGIIAILSEGRILAIELPPTVDLAITTCDPAMRGASATARTKPATLSTGLVVQVPEYLAPGESIRVDTRTGKYLSRT